MPYSCWCIQICHNEHLSGGLTSLSELDECYLVCSWDRECDGISSEVAWVAPAKRRCHVPCNVNYFHPYPVSRRVLRITLRAAPFLALNRRASAAFGGTVGLRNQCYSKVCLADALLNQRNSIRYSPLSTFPRLAKVKTKNRQGYINGKC